ncbi:hypothetical protein AURANDRAFT_70956 [Aureococcus anophagefferens]|uniref:Uncharacterized protein n=1 Tax=Aureococcus anophagefferens TaxID=44056 RepID=F0Y043_AURAN|nr:hypothetical protein AURANDRAFT_70956 [Aureococcus anophagefferens]EGB11509.1 hypothetical protein AURANDRAFT_70956 [Aureococcus anophagefferens]|eukprot:XP_009033868.1 hypothetical protein AURANDRAFT_70956 [Aureococcus anophagefferens]
MLRLAVGIAAALSSPLAHAETTTRAPPEESAGSLRSKADEALISGRTDEALSLLGKAIGLEPLNERNLYKRARVYLRAKRIADAIGDLGAALKLAPEYEAALASRAKALASVGRCAEAGEDWKVARLVAKKDAAKRDADAGAAAAAACVKELADAARARKRGDRRLELEHLNVVLETYADAQPAALLLDRARAHAANGDWYPLRYECEGCGKHQRIGHPMWRYQASPTEFGTTTWACHRLCRRQTNWRLIAEDVRRVPDGDAPESWGRRDEWLRSVREYRLRRLAEGPPEPDEGRRCTLS